VAGNPGQPPKLAGGGKRSPVEGQTDGNRPGTGTTGVDEKGPKNCKRPTGGLDRKVDTGHNRNKGPTTKQRKRGGGKRKCNKSRGAGSGAEGRVRPPGVIATPTGRTT